MNLRLFLKCNGRALRAVCCFGGWGDGEGSDFAAILYQIDPCNRHKGAYQKLKKSLTSFSLVLWAIFLT